MHYYIIINYIVIITNDSDVIMKYYDIHHEFCIMTSLKKEKQTEEKKISFWKIKTSRHELGYKSECKDLQFRN